MSNLLELNQIFQKSNLHINLVHFLLQLLDPNLESTTLISDKARVYKGGSWLDRAYYLDPAQRRYQLESMTSNFIGFRCAMSYLGEVRNTKKSRKR